MPVNLPIYQLLSLSLFVLAYKTWVSFTSYPQNVLQHWAKSCSSQGPHLRLPRNSQVGSQGLACIHGKTFTSLKVCVMVYAYSFLANSVAFIVNAHAWTHMHKYVSGLACASLRIQTHQPAHCVISLHPQTPQSTCAHASTTCYCSQHQIERRRCRHHIWVYSQSVHPSALRATLHTAVCAPSELRCRHTL